MEESSSTKKRVAVIGAGCAGIIASRILSCREDKFDYEVYERGSSVGGLWVYNERTGTDVDGYPVHSAMYRDLVTNSPKQLQEYPDFQLPPGIPYFQHHSQVLKYLQDFVEHFRLKEHMHFNSIVKLVSRKPSSDPRQPQWLIKTLNTQTLEENSSVFDAILICTGKYSTPFYPEFPQGKNFDGTIIHSHDYRYPETFKNKHLLLLGGSSSVFDILKETSAHAESVVVSIKAHDSFCLKDQYINGILPEHVRVTDWVKSIKGKEVTFESGKSAEFDAIIFCTGYKFYFPFLDESCEVVIDGHRRITPLFKHMVHIKYNTLFFINMAYNPIDFVLPFVTVPLALNIIDGSHKLPSESEMEKDTETDFNQRRSYGLQTRHAHSYIHPPYQPKDYVEDICEYGNIPNVLINNYKCLGELQKSISTNIFKFRDYTYD